MSTGAAIPEAPAGPALEFLVRRAAASRAFFPAHADWLARLCQQMAEAFATGGRLVAFGASCAARSDARHVAVEFVHPVIVGKRALPAIALTRESGPLAVQADLALRSGDIAMAFGTEAEEDGAEEACEALALARSRGCVTVAFSAASGAEWEFAPPSTDPFVRQELVETLYHVLWELVHVFFEHGGLLEGRPAGTRHGAGASGFLYPFLERPAADPAGVLDDVRASILMKAEETKELRTRTVEGSHAEILAAAATVRAAFEAGNAILAFGNGGSATDAMDVVADFRNPPHGWPRRRALDLTEDSAILTALANDIGPESLFARQVIAHARPPAAPARCWASCRWWRARAPRRRAARARSPAARTGLRGRCRWPAP